MGERAVNSLQLVYVLFGFLLRLLLLHLRRRRRLRLLLLSLLLLLVLLLGNQYDAMRLRVVT